MYQVQQPGLQGSGSAQISHMKQKQHLNQSGSGAGNQGQIGFSLASSGRNNSG